MRSDSFMYARTRMNQSSRHLESTRLDLENYLRDHFLHHGVVQLYFRSVKLGTEPGTYRTSDGDFRACRVGLVMERLGDYLRDYTLSSLFSGSY